MSRNIENINNKSKRDIINFPIIQPNWEKICICTSNLEKVGEKEKEQLVLKDFEFLDFVNTLCSDPSDLINYNEEKKANPFDKISKYYGRKKDVFLFISILRNEKYFNEIMSIVSSKCDEHTKAQFVDHAKLYLELVENGERLAKELLSSSEFSGAFLMGYPENRFQNLNVNFTNNSQCLNITKIFDRNWINNEIICETERIKIYNQGQRVATIQKDITKMLKFSFKKNCSSQLIINRVFENKNYTMSIDFNFHEIIYVDLKIDEAKAEARQILNLSWDTEVIFVNEILLTVLLEKYFSYLTGRLITSKKDECFPIETLEDLKAWCPSEQKSFSKKLVKRKEFDGPKTLVCHDMKGGYLEDRFVEGTLCENPYFFVHWSQIDTFVYFSHHLVTIPPCGWISAAHVNGVKVLGTFITEWNDGEQICQDAFASENSVLELSNQLVKIALHYNFDGWLINIENPIENCKIPLIIKFVKTLTDRMHVANSGSQVIWYDSVLKSGELEWQNGLNKFNRMFFHACDGIFLNYNWKEEHLLESVHEAESRKYDVYVGVDVFGRGCLGGGGFSTNVAVAEARKFGLSVAIFAPGWVLECLPVKDFKENQFKFWNALESFLPPRTIKELPYCSSFCPGFGEKIYRKGKVISEKPWYNLSLQQPQPLFCHHSCGSVSLHTDEAFNGGGCLLLNGRYDLNEPLSFKILETFFKFNVACKVTLAFKCLSDNVKVVLVLSVLTGEGMLLFNLDTVDGGIHEVSEVSENLQKEYSDEKKNNILTYEKGVWNERDFILPLEITQINIMKKVAVKLIPINSKMDQVQVLIGQLEITPVQNGTFEYRDLYIVHDAKNTIEVKCTLLWDFKSPVICDLYFISKDGHKSYINTSLQQSFDLKLNIDITFEKLELLVLLCPQNTGNSQFPTLSLKIPLKPK